MNTKPRKEYLNQLMSRSDVLKELKKQGLFDKSENKYQCPYCDRKVVCHSLYRHLNQKEGWNQKCK
jgi:hypothetical protein